MSILNKINKFRRDLKRVKDFTGSVAQGAESVRDLIDGRVSDDARLGPGLASINQIAANLGGGIAKPSRYAVYFSPPRVLANENMGYLLFRTLNTELPGQNINVINVKPHGIGNPRSMPTAFNIYPYLGVNFMASQDLREYALFSRWMDNIVKKPNVKSENTRGFHLANYQRDYACSISIVLYDEEGNSVYEAFFKDCWPVQLEPVDLNWDNTNQLLTFRVQFAFTSWYDYTIGDGVQSKFPNIIGGLDSRIGAGIAGALETGFKVFGVESKVPQRVFDAVNVISGGGLFNFD